MSRRNNGGVGGSGAVSLPRAFEIVTRSLEEAVQEATRALEVEIEERLNLLAQRMEEKVATLAERMEEKVTTLAERMEERVATLAEGLARVERRVMALESSSATAQRSGGEEAAVKKLEGRVQQLEASVQKALEGVFPRVDSLLQQLEGNCPPAPFAIASTSSASPSPSTRLPNDRCGGRFRTTSYPQPFALPSVSSTARTSSASPSPLAPSTADPSSTPSTASAPPPPIDSAKDIALGKELLEAAEGGRVTDVKRLLNEGANVNHRDAIEWTPLMNAAFNGHAAVVSLLLDYYSFSLCKGGSIKRTEIRNVLLERGADVNAKDQYENTALYWASGNDRSGRCVKLLLDGGAHVQCRNGWGRTALHYAAFNNNVQAVRLLIAAGASNTVKDNDGKAPSDVTGNSVIREILISSC